MEETKQVRFCGLGGQGILLAGSLFCRAALDEWEFVCGSSAYGASVSGGLCSAEAVLSHQPVSYPKVIRSDVMVAMSQDAYKKYIDEANNNGIVFYDEGIIIKQIDNLKQICIPITKIAAKTFKSSSVANMIILGIITKATKLVSYDTVLKTVGDSVSERFRKLNADAVNAGYNYEIS